MKRSKFTEAQIAFVLKQVEDGTSIAEVCRKAGIAETTFYNWRKTYVRYGYRRIGATGRTRKSGENDFCSFEGCRLVFFGPGLY